MLHRFQRRSRGVKVFLLFALALFLPTATSTSASAAGLSAGATHACAAKTDGTVWCWGSNDSAELGSAGEEAPTPRQVTGLTGATAVSVGSAHSCALITGGTVKCWGQNINGQIGDGTGGLGVGENQFRPAPTTVSGLTDVTAIAAGAFHTCALRAGGTVSCWGFNAAGQLGDGSAVDRKAPVAVAGLTGVGSISAGGTHTCAITSGAVQCWGNNSNDQLGAATPGNTSTAPVTVAGVAGITAISAGSSHTCAINTSKSALCWGSNDDGQLGDGTKVSRTAAAAVPGLTSVQSVSAGGGQTCAVKTDGTASCWGNGTSGELGNGSTTDSLIPSAVVGLSTATSVAAGPNFTCALLSNQTASCWGDGYSGQTGSGIWSGTAAAKTPLTVPGLTSVTAVGSGFRTACAVASSALQCWGWGGDGNLGSGISGPAAPSPTPVSGVPGSVTAVGSGFVHSCALTSVGTVYCWGNNASGQLGNGSSVDASSPVLVGSGLTNVTALSVGAFSTCAVTSNGGGQVWCWGGNDAGQLGDDSPSTSQSSNVPVPATAFGFTGAQAVSVGNEHACAIDGSDDVWCWGNGEDGQLGDASAASRKPVAAGVTGVQGIGVGIAHSCAWLAGGSVQCWGDDSSGQLGDGPTDSSSDTPIEAIPSSSGVTALAVGGYHACVLLGGTAKCWGNNSLGQIGDGTLTEAPDEVSVSGLSTATALTAGFGQSCATISGSTLSCWGDAYYGQAGNGATAGNFSLTGLAAPVAGLTSIIPDPVAELPKGPPSQPDPPVTPQPPVVVPPVVDPPRPEPTLLFTKTKLKITALLLSPSGKSCPKKLTLTVSSGKAKQSGSVKTKKVTEGKKTKCSVTATFTIKNAKLKKAKSLKVRLSGKGIKTFTKTVKVTAAPKAA